MTRERPILFSGAMVRAILEGRKTQTRRLWKMPRGLDWYVSGCMRGEETGDIHDPATSWWGHIEDMACPYGRPGDRLWVRETWAQPAALDPGPTVYRADYPACVPTGFQNLPPAEAISWKPSIHMPRELCRLVLEITGVRVERLNDCSQLDAIAEGIAPELDGWMDYSNPSCQMCLDPVDSYRTLWNSINGAGAWERNPWVWVVEFRRIQA